MRGTVRPVVATVAASGLILAASCASSKSPTAATSPVPSPSPSPSTVTQTVIPSSPPSSSSDFAAAYEREHSGVVRISEVTCNGSYAGSGFLVAPDMVATAGHVVAGATALSITDPVSGASTSAQVVGFDAVHDVALVRTQGSLTGYVFSFAAAVPQVGSRIAAIGYPLDGPESIAEGAVSGLDRTITVGDGPTLVGLIQTDTSINPGNSGGPMIGPDGAVVGIADAGSLNAQGINYAVPADQAAPLVADWRQHPASISPAACQGPAPTPVPKPTPAPTQTQPPSTAPSTAIDDATATLIRYVNLINAQDFADAYALLTPAGQQHVGSQSQWAQNLSGSFYASPQIVGSQSLPGGGFDIELTFTSTQPGQTCKNWDLDYHLLPGPNGGYLIDIAVPHDGGSGYTPC